MGKPGNKRGGERNLPKGHLRGWGNRVLPQRGASDRGPRSAMFTRTRETGPFGLPLEVQGAVRAWPSDRIAVGGVRKYPWSKKNTAGSMDINNCRASIGHGGSSTRGESLMGRRGTPLGGHAALQGGASLSEVGDGLPGARTSASVIQPSPDHNRRGGTPRQGSLQGGPVRANGGLPAAGRLAPQALAGGWLNGRTLVRTLGHVRKRGRRHGRLPGPDTPGRVSSPHRHRTHRGAGGRLAHKARAGVQNAQMPAHMAGAMPLGRDSTGSAREAVQDSPFTKMEKCKAGNLFRGAASCAQELKIPRHAWGNSDPCGAKGKLSKVGGKHTGTFPPAWGPSVGELSNGEEQSTPLPFGGRIPREDMALCDKPFGNSNSMTQREHGQAHNGGCKVGESKRVQPVVGNVRRFEKQFVTWC
jgi:hypothetical protein